MGPSPTTPATLWDWKGRQNPERSGGKQLQTCPWDKGQDLRAVPSNCTELTQMPRIRHVKMVTLSIRALWVGDTDDHSTYSPPSALLTPSSLRLSGSGEGVQRPLSYMESRTSCSNLNGSGRSLVSQVTDGGCLASNKQTPLENQNQKARPRWWQWRHGVSSQIRQGCYVRVLPQWHFLQGQRSSRQLAGLSPGCAWEF